MSLTKRILPNAHKSLDKWTCTSMKGHLRRPDRIIENNLSHLNGYLNTKHSLASGKVVSFKVKFRPPTATTVSISKKVAGTILSRPRMTKVFESSRWFH